jgi:hypothetical protein
MGRKHEHWAPLFQLVFLIFSNFEGIKAMKTINYGMNKEKNKYGVRFSKVLEISFGIFIYSNKSQ